MSESIPVIRGGLTPPEIGEAAHSDLVAGLFREQLSRKTPSASPDPGSLATNADMVEHKATPRFEPAFTQDFGDLGTIGSPFSTIEEPVAPAAPVSELSLGNGEPQPKTDALNPPPIHSLSPGSVSSETEPKRAELPYGEPLGPRLHSSLRGERDSAGEGRTVHLPGQSDTPS